MSRLSIPGIILVLLMEVGCSSLPGQAQQKRNIDLETMQLVGLNGRPITLEMRHNKLLLLDFFTTWSQSTAVIIPAYIRIYKRYHPCGLEMVGIALDDLGAKVVEPFVRGMGIPYPVALADKEIKEGRSTFGQIDFVPLLLIVGKDGGLVESLAGLAPIAKIEKTIQNALGGCP